MYMYFFVPGTVSIMYPPTRPVNQVSLVGHVHKGQGKVHCFFLWVTFIKRQTHTSQSEAEQEGYQELEIQEVDFGNLGVNGKTVQNQLAPPDGVAESDVSERRASVLGSI